MRTTRWAMTVLALAGAASPAAAAETTRAPFGQMPDGGRVEAITVTNDRQADAAVIEPQMFPDVPTRPEFGSVCLNPGQTCRNNILFRFSTVGAR